MTALTGSQRFLYGINWMPKSIIRTLRKWRRIPLEAIFQLYGVTDGENSSRQSVKNTSVGCNLKAIYNSVLSAPKWRVHTYELDIAERRSMLQHKNVPEYPCAEVHSTVP